MAWPWTEQSGVLQGLEEIWALQLHSVNASLDPVIQARVFTCYVPGDGRDGCQFPKREKKQLEKKEMADCQ